MGVLPIDAFAWFVLLWSETAKQDDKGVKTDSGDTQDTFMSSTSAHPAPPLHFSNMRGAFSLLILQSHSFHGWRSEGLTPSPSDPSARHGIHQGEERLLEGGLDNETTGLRRGSSAEFGSCHVFSKRSPPAGLARPADMVPWGRPDPSCHGEEVCARHPDPHGFGKKDDLANVFGQRFGDWPVAGRNGGLYPSMGRGAAEENRAPMRWTSGRLYLRYALLAEDLFFNGVSARLSSLESGNVTPTCFGGWEAPSDHVPSGNLWDFFT